MADAVAIAAVLVILWAVFSKNLLATDNGGLTLDTSVPPGTPQPGQNSTSPAPDLSTKIKQFAQAIGVAEGFGQPDAVPTLYNNPGDLGPGDTGYEGVFHGGSIVSQLPDVATGWRLLEQKIANAFSGQSSVYNSNMTFAEWAQKYAGDWVNWSKNVAGYLGVDPNTRISDWLQQP